MPDGFTATETSQDYGPLAPGATSTVSFIVTDTNSTLPDGQLVQIPITTTFGTGNAGTGQRDACSCRWCRPPPSPEATADPVVDAKADAG